MSSTAPLVVRADRACVYAAAARAKRKASLAKQKHAVRERALAMIYEIRKSGGHVSRSIESALRRQH